MYLYVHIMDQPLLGVTTVADLSAEEIQYFHESMNNNYNNGFRMEKLACSHCLFVHLSKMHIPLHYEVFCILLKNFLK